MQGTDPEEFIRSLQHENGNLELVLEKVPFLDRALLLLSMATAVNCMDWNEPSRTKDACIGSIRNVTDYAVTLFEQWAPPGQLIYGGQLDLEQDDWNGLFMQSQSLARDLLQLHLQTFGSDTDEKILHAYNETLFCLTYMISAGCARSTDPKASVEFAVRNIEHVFEFIGKNCRRVEM